MRIVSYHDTKDEQIHAGTKVSTNTSTLHTVASDCKFVTRTGTLSCSRPTSETLVKLIVQSNLEPDVPKGEPNGAVRSKFYHSMRLQFVVYNGASSVFHRPVNRPINR